MADRCPLRPRSICTSHLPLSTHPPPPQYQYPHDIANPQGHSNCVGCNSALNVARLPPVPASTPLQRFLGPCAALARSLFTPDGPPSLDLLIEENVMQQVKNLRESEIIQQDWKRRGSEGVTIHGWVYQLEDGTIRDLEVSVGPPGADKRRVGGRDDRWD